MTIKTNTFQNIIRILLGLVMTYIGIGHLTFLQIDFQAQVPTWITTQNDLVDLIIITSGIIEIILGLLMVIGGKLKVKTGVLLAIFYILIFPGNINQYVNEIDAFNLNSDTSRFVRLLFQPILVFLALFSSGGLWLLKDRKQKS
ncbi:hypothetical protein N8131_01795 [Flavobacteriaceae bacterium]|jgi:uncharacterized membrane protein|nr:hypothetical protein [Flavobacteriaceae bacterium]|tara:strand:+ start:3522 stop:3953 length:432 start_codon:yes stop_codon:yes gene_type:complete